MGRYIELTPEEAAAWSNDALFLAWIEGTGAIVIATELKVLLHQYKHPLTFWEDRNNLS